MLQFPNSLLEEEAAKRAELEQIHLQQQMALSQTEAEKQELMAERMAKERDLEAAMLQLGRLEKERHGALEQYKVRKHARRVTMIHRPENTDRNYRFCIKRQGNWNLHVIKLIKIWKRL